MQKLIVEPQNDGKKLITYVTSKFPNLKIATFRKALRQKDIKINGKRISKETTLLKGDEIIIYISDELLLKQGGLEIKTVYEDENIVVFNKPTNLEVEGQESLSEIMGDNYVFLRACHRIDRNTTGLVLFAKNEESLKIIEKAFRSGNIEKHYIACCYGISKSNKTLEAYLFKDRKKSLVYISQEYKKGYFKIKTSYKTIKQNIQKKLSLLDVTLHTGKTHQIRAHLASIGLPIVGDGKYGSYKINRKYNCNKQMLCSYSIAFSNIDDDKLKYLNNKTIKLKQIPYLELFNEE